MNELAQRFDDRRASIGERVISQKAHVDELFDTFYKALNELKENILMKENRVLLEFD